MWGAVSTDCDPGHGRSREVTILVVGYNAFDVIVPVDGLPSPDTKTEVSDILCGGGGPAATAAVCLARLGARVRLVTVLGDDEGAAVQRRELAAAGVDLSLARTAVGCRSPRAVILVDPAREERTVLWSRGDLPTLWRAADVDLAWLDHTDLLYCDGHEPAATLPLAVEARRRGLPVVYDAGSVRDGSRDLAAVCTDVHLVATFRTGPHRAAATDRPSARLPSARLRSLGPTRVVCHDLRRGRPAGAGRGDGRGLPC